MVRMVLNSMAKTMVMTVAFRSARPEISMVMGMPICSSGRHYTRGSTRVAATWCLAAGSWQQWDFTLSSLNGTNGFKLDGENNNDYSGLFRQRRRGYQWRWDSDLIIGAIVIDR